MSSFSQDRKWSEAKRAVGSSNWLEVISYYRSIGGKNVFVYSVIEGDKRLIVDILDNDHVILVNKKGKPVIDSYTSVVNSRKLFKYSEKVKQEVYTLGNKEYLVTIESHN